MKTTIKLITIAYITTFLFSSCARNYTYLHGENQKKDAGSSALEIESRYAGMASDHAVFEVSITNKSDENLTFATRDILLRLEDMTTDNVIRLFPENKYDMRDWLFLNGRSLQRGNYRSSRPKGPYTQGRANFDEHEKVDYIRHTNPRFLGLMEGFDQDHREYIEKYVFEREVIGPGETSTFDLFFKRRMQSGSVQLEFSTEDGSVIVPYDFNYMVVKLDRF